MTDTSAPHKMNRLPAEAALYEARASKILTYMARKSRYQLNQRNRAVEVFLNGYTQENYVPDDPECVISWRTIERFAASWRLAVPASAEMRAALAHRLAAQYALVQGEMPNLWAVLGLDEPAVREAHQALYGTPLETLFVPSTPSDSPCESSAPVDWIDLPDLEFVERSIQLVHLPGGTTLFKEGDPGDSMYVICSGRMQVMAGDRVIAERGRDELVGEMALLTGARRSATLRALRDSDLYRLSKEAYENLAAHYPRIALHLTRTLAERLADSIRQERRAHPVTTVSVFPAGKEAETRAFCLALADALRPYGAVMHIHSGLVDQSLEPGAAQAEPGSFEDQRLTGWLNDCEDNHRFLIYESGAAPDEWARRCMRQADRLLLVGQAGRDPALSAVEEYLFQQASPETRSACELVLLQPSQSQLPRNTRAWLDPRPVRDHHQVVLSQPRHLARLARMLTGRPFCVVLSGGAVRGFAHAGVIRALREAEIDVDYIGGASAGSIVAGLFAMGNDDRDLVKVSQTIMKDASKLFNDYTWPAASVSSARRLNNVFKDLFGETLIEDLWIHFYCTSVDLTDARLLVHQQGPLRRWVRASTSMPVVFPPVVHQHHLLVDGGVMNNLPINPMLEIAPGGTLLASNVGSDFYPASEPFTYGDDLPFWTVFNARVNPFAKKMLLPGIGNVLMRTIEISSKSFEAEQVARADIYVVPPIGNSSLFKVDDVPLWIEIGYQEAAKQIAAWKERA